MTKFAKYSWFVLGFNILVILWGAVVRATGSGAGCGSHWPSCNGEVLPANPTIETLIEFTHRLTSGVALILVVGMFLWARRAYKSGNPVRKAAVFSLVFIGIEALIGAGLVLNELVADNDSLFRAVTIAVHLANTFLLLGALTLTAWWASGNAPVRLKGQGPIAWFFLAGGLALLVLGMTGAITALGDTLFPAESLSQGLQQDFSGNAHFLIELRIIHPITAILTGIYLFLLAVTVSLQRPSPVVQRFAGMVLILIFIQLLAGALNVVLLAPVWMQIVHLLLADVIWILFVILSAVTFSADTVGAGVPTSSQPRHPEHPQQPVVSFDLSQSGEVSDGSR
jgi:heme A synthase